MKITIDWLITICLVLAGLSPLCTHAEEKPLWEAGLGIAHINFPYYRGSNERKSYVLPAPYLVYRGEFLKISKESVRGQLFKSDNIELNISVNASIPVSSSNIQARHGMPDLKPTFEIGPSLDIHLLRSKKGIADLDLRLPVRTAYTTQLSSAGWLFQPQLNADFKNIVGNTGWNLGVVTGLIFADQRYNRYFYGVDSTFATSDRSAYNARGGYLGGQFILALSKRYQNFWVGGFGKWDTLNGAVVADSPLVERKLNTTMGIAVSWLLGQSHTMVNSSFDHQQP